MKKDNFIFYLEWLRTMEAAMLSKNEKSRLIDAIVAYADTGVVQELPRLLMAIFAPIKTTMDSNAEKYEARANINRANGAKGGRPKGSEKPKITQENPMGYSGFPQKTEKTHSHDYVYDNVYDNDFVYDAEATAPENEKGKIYEIFFWRNFVDPHGELARFYEYNGKRKWKALDTPNKRINAAMAEWQPADSKKRVREEFLTMWYELYIRIKQQDPDIALLMIDTKARCECQGSEAKIRAQSKTLRTYIEKSMPPEIMQYIGDLKLTTAAP
jgi:hypothetical protein